MALGIAASQPIGVREQFGTMTKSFHIGGAARAGLMAALMAKHGYTASIACTRSAARPDADLLDQVRLERDHRRTRQRFEIASNTYKPFACGIVIHPAIDGCVQLRNEHGLRAEDIERIDLKVHPLVLELTGKTAPRHRARGQVQRLPRVRRSDHFRTGGRTRVLGCDGCAPDVIALRDRIKAQADDAIDEDAADIRVTCRDGRSLHLFVEHAIGSMERPLSDADLHAKFHGLVDPVLGAARAGQLIEQCARVGQARRSARLDRVGARLGRRPVSAIFCRYSRRFVALVFYALSHAPARADDYPSRPVRVIVPFSPGGAVDGPMRLIAQELGKRLGQSVVVENRPGAGATIGTEAVAKAPADGYTLLLASQTNAISATLYPKLSFDPIEDFAPITLIGREPGVVVVHPSLPVKTLQELIAYVKAHPGQVDYASSGNGSGQHLFAALLCSMTGMKMNHIPYRGSGQATTDLLGGQVQVSIPGMAGMLGHIKSGKLRALAVTGATRAPQLPDVPTVSEAGVAGLRSVRLDGPARPQGHAAAVIDRLQREVVAALATPRFATTWRREHRESSDRRRRSSERFFRAEKDTWAKIVRETGAKVD